MAKQPIFQTPNNELCPLCSAELVIKNGAHGPFYACSTYPACEYVRSLKPSAESHIIKVLDGQHCPACGGTLVLRQGRYGMFIGCSEYPACEHIEQIDKPDETMIECPQCKKGHLLQRKSRFGKIFYACDGYPDCQFSLNQKPITGECEYCHYPLLMEKRTSVGVKLFCVSKLCMKQQTSKE